MKGNARCLLLTLGLAGTCFSMQAQEPRLAFSASLKTGYDFAPKDMLNAGFYGFGFQADYALNSTWGLGLELTYTTQPGRMYRAALGAPAAGRPAPSPSLSADGRKNSLESLALRASAQRELGHGWWLMAGLHLGNTRFRHEYIGQAAPADRSYNDTYNATPTEFAFKASPFVGGQWRLDADNAFEVILMGRMYKAIDFHHTPGAALVSGTTSQAGSHLVYEGDHLEQKDRMSLQIEVGYRFRF